MALFARTTVETVDFYSEMDPDVTVREVPLDADDPEKGTKKEKDVAEGASRFKIGPLDVFLMAHIYDNASKLSGKQGSEEVGIETRMNATNIDAVRFGLRALPEGFRNKQGTEIKYEVEKRTVNGREYTAVKDSVLSTLGIRLIGEMAEAIKDLSEVSADEEKNSASA